MIYSRGRYRTTSFHPQCCCSAVRTPHDSSGRNVYVTRTYVSSSVQSTLELTKYEQDNTWPPHPKVHIPPEITRTRQPCNVTNATNNSSCIHTSFRAGEDILRPAPDVSCRAVTHTYRTAAVNVGERSNLFNEESKTCTGIIGLHTYCCSTTLPPPTLTHAPVVSGVRNYQVLQV